jgi:hypothetical protein
VSLSVLSILIASWIEHVKQEYQLDNMFHNLLAKWHSNSLEPQKYSFQDGLLLYKGGILLVDNV